MRREVYVVLFLVISMLVSACGGQSTGRTVKGSEEYATLLEQPVQREIVPISIVNEYAVSSSGSSPQEQKLQDFSEWSVTSSPGSKNDIIEDAITYAVNRLGFPYVTGGESDSEGGYDCSGLMWQSYRQALEKIGVSLPWDLRVCGGAWNEATTKVAGAQKIYSNPKRGDWLFFIDDNGKVDHCAIMTSESDFIEATGSGMMVKRSSLDPNHEGYRGDLAKRVLGWVRLIESTNDQRKIYPTPQPSIDSDVHQKNGVTYVDKAPPSLSQFERDWVVTSSIEDQPDFSDWVVFSKQVGDGDQTAIVTMSREEMNFRLLEREIPPVPFDITLTYWNSQPITTHIPYDIWVDLVEAGVKEGVDPRLLAALGISESPTFNNIVCSGAGACGRFQFMPGTFPTYSDPGMNIFNGRDSTFAAARMVSTLRINKQYDEQSFVNRFAGLDGGLVWNAHVGQARFVWRYWQELIKQTAATWEKYKLVNQIVN